MSLSRWQKRVARAMAEALPGFEGGDFRVSRQRVQVPMSDGVLLRADLVMPEHPVPGSPTLLSRSPYGRDSAQHATMTMPFASHGLPVLLVSSRGMFGSGGEFRAAVDEERDGVDTIRWLRRQPWFTGRLAMVGGSYPGFSQWAAAAGCLEEPGLSPEAHSMPVTLADFAFNTWANGVFSVSGLLGWATALQFIDKPAGQARLRRRGPWLEKALTHRPLIETDVVAVGTRIEWYREWASHEDPRDDYWRDRSHSDVVARVAAPVLMTAGWFDIFLPLQLETYQARREAGRETLLTIGPWLHSSPEAGTANVVETLRLFDSVFGGSPLSDDPVRYFVTGAEEWRSGQVWPPPTATRVEHLRADGSLSAEAPSAPHATALVFDPAAPTPATPLPMTGPRPDQDDRERESRADVLVFTGEALRDDLEIVGAPRAEVWLRSDVESVDVFVRLCDVGPDGTSSVIADGIQRVGSPGTRASDPPRAPDGAWRIAFDLRPCAHRFAAGHRLRVQVSSGAHPRYRVNTGTGRPAAFDTELRVAHNEVLHEPERASAIHLPVRSR